MSWEQGRSTIEDLIGRGELQRVVADRAAAGRLIEDAERHLTSCETIKQADPNGAFAIAYDAIRKACSALLEAQGLRATSRGGHIALRDAVVAQFADLSGGGVLRPFDRLRRRRNMIEYPDNEASADLAEVEEAAIRARDILDFAANIVGHLPPFT